MIKLRIVLEDSKYYIEQRICLFFWLRMLVDFRDMCEVSYYIKHTYYLRKPKKVKTVVVELSNDDIQLIKSGTNSIEGWPRND